MLNSWFHVALFRTLYTMRISGNTELALIFGFEESSCCLYFILSVVRCPHKYKTSHLGFSSADEFLVIVQLL